MASIHHIYTPLDPDNLPYRDIYHYVGSGPLLAVNEHFRILPKLVFLSFSLKFQTILSTHCLKMYKLPISRTLGGGMKNLFPFSYRKMHILTFYSKYFKRSDFLSRWNDFLYKGKIRGMEKANLLERKTILLQVLVPKWWKMLFSSQKIPSRAS